MKKILAVVLALTVIVAMFAGCELIDVVLPQDDKPVTTAEHEAEKEKNRPAEPVKQPELEPEPEPDPDVQYTVSDGEAKKFFDTFMAGEWSNYFSYPVFWYNQFSSCKFEGYKMGNQDGFKRFIRSYYEYIGDKFENHYADMRNNPDKDIDAGKLTFIENAADSGCLKKLADNGIITENDRSKFNFQGGSYWYTLVKVTEFGKMADTLFGKGSGTDISKGAEFVTETGYAAFATGGLGGITEPVFYRFESVKCDGEKAYVKGNIIHEFNDTSNGTGTDGKVYLVDEITGEIKAVYSDYNKRPYKDYETLLKCIENEKFDTFTMELFKDADGVHLKNITTEYNTGEYYTVTAEPNLRVRKEPTTESEKLGNLPPQLTVYVSEIKDGWGKVKYMGQEGWISLKYTDNNHGVRH